MTRAIFTNDAITAVSSGGTDAPASGTNQTWTVADSSTFPAASNSASPPTTFHVVDASATSEKILVTNVSGQTWSVTRGDEGTTPVAHQAGFTIRHVVTAGDLANIRASASGISLTPTAVKTGNYTANPGDSVPVDTTSGVVTVTLPNAPASLSTVAVQHVKGGNAVTVAAAGSDVFQVAGGTTTRSLAVTDGLLWVLYNGGIWYIIAGTPATISLDAIAAAVPTAADWSNNSHKITSLANGSAAQDAAAFGQLASASSPLALSKGGTGTSAGSAAALLSTLGAAALAGATFTGWTAPAVVALTDAATIAVNAALGNDFRVTLGGNRTLGAPSNPVDGQRIDFQITQDATGSRTLAYNAVYSFSTGLPSPTLTTTANKTDLLGFIYNATKAKWLFVAFVAGFS